MNKRNGFTLIELMLSVVILSILSGMTISVLGQNRTRDRAKDAVVRSNLEAAVSAIDAYYYGEGEYPLESEDGNPLNNISNTSLSIYLQQWPDGLTYKYDSTFDIYAVIARREINTNYYKYISSCAKIIECESAVPKNEEDTDIMGSVTFCIPVTSEADPTEDFSCLLVDDLGGGGVIPPQDPDPDPDPEPPTTLPNGSSCTLGSQCTSTICSEDGVCCDTACSGSTCQSCDANSSAGAGTCGPTIATADPDNECTASGYTSCSGNNQIGSDGNCSGTTYACKADGASSPCPVAGACQTGGGCSSGVCQEIITSPDTNWKDNLYNCPTDSRCVAGTCHACSGIVAPDGCSGCAEQGGYACWFNGIASGSCTASCVNRGGCIAKAWKDPSPCTICKALNSGETRCVSSSQGAAPYWRSSDGCHYRTVAQVCTDSYGTYRQCVCKW